MRFGQSALKTQLTALGGIYNHEAQKEVKRQKEGAETLGNASARGKVEKNEKQNTQPKKGTRQGYHKK